MLARNQKTRLNNRIRYQGLSSRAWRRLDAERKGVGNRDPRTIL